MHVVASILRRSRSFGSIVLSLGLFCAAAHAQSPAEPNVEHHFGLGLIVGHPNGLSLKGYLSPDTAIDGAIGFGDTFRILHLHADYLWHFAVQRWDAASLQLYLGAGAELESHSHPGPRSDTDFFFGVRAPFGFSLMFSAPFDVFAELVAGAWFAEEAHLHVDAALGARYWF